MSTSRWQWQIEGVGRGGSADDFRICCKVSRKSSNNFRPPRATWKHNKARQMGAVWTEWKFKEKCRYKVLFCAITAIRSFITLLYTVKNELYTTTQWLESDEAAPKENNVDSLVVVNQCYLLQLPESSETITTEKFWQEIDEMHRNLQCLLPTLANRKNSILIHYSTRKDVAQPTLQKLNELDYETLHHTPYSPDLSPIDYHFFSISITSYKRRPLTTMMLFKMCLSIPRYWNSVLLESIILFFVIRNVLDCSCFD